MKILVVEDNLELLDDIREFLELEGNICEVATDFRSAYMKLGVFKYDLLVVDIGLPDGNGLDIIREVKKENIDMGIIIISARSELEDKVGALELGADDYLTKPFFLAELNARARALYRRKVYQGNQVIHFNEIRIEPARYEVYIHGSFLQLTKKEFDILHFFVTNKNRLLTKEAIAEHIWGDNIEAVDSFTFISTHLANLRKKIADLGGNDYIKSIYRVGYKFTDQE